MAATSTRLYCFTGGSVGPWRVDAVLPVIGMALVKPQRLAVSPASTTPPAPHSWQLSGITSNDRYVERTEKLALLNKQEGLGRPASTHAALIPIRKSAAWWALTQDERRDIFERQSAHIGIGMKYLPKIARRLHHCRDLGHDQPFDFLTWFEYAPEDSKAFDDLLAALRTSPEWAYVDWEVDIRLTFDFG
jgi:chlorite dismutase